MTSYTYDETRANCHGNKYNQWNNALGSGHAAKDRYGEDFFYVNTTPKTRFPRSAKVFPLDRALRAISSENYAQMGLLL